MLADTAGAYGGYPSGVILRAVNYLTCMYNKHGGEFSGWSPHMQKQTDFVIGVDPGPDKSAVVVYDGVKLKPVYWDHCDNNEVRVMLSLWSNFPLAIEKIECFGQIAGASLFETCYATGRFAECHRGHYNRIGRREVKLHLCGTVKARDSDVRRAIMHRFGGRTEALGNTKNPGPLRPIKGHVWQALAVALVWWDCYRGIVAPESETETEKWLLS